MNTLFKEALYDLVDDRPVITLLVYTNRKFWHYKRLAKKYSKKVTFSQKEIIFFESHGLKDRSRKIKYYSILNSFAKEINNYDMITYCNYFFYDLITEFKNDVTAVSYLKSLLN